MKTWYINTLVVSIPDVKCIKKQNVYQSWSIYVHHLNSIPDVQLDFRVQVSDCIFNRCWTMASSSTGWTSATATATPPPSSIALTNPFQSTSPLLTSNTTRTTTVYTHPLPTRHPEHSGKIRKNFYKYKIRATTSSRERKRWNAITSYQTYFGATISLSSCKS